MQPEKYAFYCKEDIHNSYPFQEDSRNLSFSLGNGCLDGSVAKSDECVF